jgi:hypothetical protein
MALVSHEGADGRSRNRERRPGHFSGRLTDHSPWHEMATSARVVTAETPAMLALRRRACADRAIRSARSPGGGAAA